MIDRYSNEQRGRELRALRDTANQLVHQRDSARLWVVRLESMLEGTCQLLREYGVWPCLDCHQGEAPPQLFDAGHHDPECRIAKGLTDADTDRGGR